MTSKDIQLGDIVSFKYKGGRFVRGEVISIPPSSFILVLHADYLGKNVDWYSGEKKDFNLINLLFTTIDKVYPPTTNFYYNESYISWPVASLIIFFPVYVLLMWLLEKSYITEPEKRNLGVRKWLTYATLFFAGLTIAIDLVTLLYCFIDGQELTAGFLLKVLIVWSSQFPYSFITFLIS